MINLDNAEVVGEGLRRRSYIHPDDPRFLLKVQVRPFVRQKHWYSRRMNVPEVNEREILGYADVVSSLGYHAPFLTRVLGFENTNLGPALLVENAAYGALKSATLKKFHRDKGAGLPFDADEVRWACEAYAKLIALFEDKRIFNHSLRPESILLCRFPEGLSLKLFDYKTVAYHQFISPRYVPGARLVIQRKTTDAAMAKLRAALDARLAQEAP